MASPVPYSGTITAAPQTDPLQQAHVDTPVAAFGGATALATEHLGEVQENAGKELFQRAYAFQELDQQAKATKALTDYQNEVNKAYLSFTENQGRNALDKYPDFEKTADQIREQFRGDLQSPYAQHAFDQESRMYQGRIKFSAGNYAREQFKEFEHATDVQAAAGNGASLPAIIGTPGAVEGVIAKNKEIGQRIVARQGFPVGSPESDNVIRSTVDVGLEPQLRNYLAGDSKALAQGQRMLEGAQGVMTPDLYAKYAEEFKTKTRTVGAAEEASTWYHNNQGYTNTGDLMDHAKSAADRLYPEDTLAHDAFVDKVRTDNLRVVQDKKVDRDQAVEDISNGVFGRMDQSGKLPTSHQELFALGPHMSDQYDKLTGAQKAAVDKHLDANIVGGYRPTPDNKKIYDNLRGAYYDPNATPQDRQKFLDTFIPGLPIPGEWAQKLMVMQKSLGKQIEGEPNMADALRAIAPIIGPSGYNISKDVNEDRYNQFLSAYHDAISEYSKGNVKPVKDDDTYRSIARTLLQSNTDELQKGWWWKIGLPSYPTEFETPGNSMDRYHAEQALRAELKKNGINADPSAADVNNYILRQKFNEMGKKNSLKSTDRVQGQ